MGRLQKVEDATEIIVGKYYLVPTVYVPSLPKRLQIVPVIGPAHEDAEFINFPHRHVHPDRRFVSDAWFSYYDTFTATGKPHYWGVVYSFEIIHDPNHLHLKLGKTGTKWHEPMVMRCKRVVSPFRDTPWMSKLETAYSHERLRDGHICPHRGISCRGVQVDDNGCVVCPGHGLQFQMESGVMVPRTNGQLRLPLGKNGRS